MNETHLSVFHYVSNHARRKRSRNTARYAFNSVCSSWARDFTTFTLHDLTDFYVERATAPHFNKLAFMFHSRWPNSETKLKWNPLESPLRGPSQLALYREDRLWSHTIIPPPANFTVSTMQSGRCRSPNPDSSIRRWPIAPQNRFPLLQSPVFACCTPLHLMLGGGFGDVRLALEVCTGSKLKPEPGPYPRSSDPTRAAQFNLEPEPDPKSPPPPPPHNE